MSPSRPLAAELPTLSFATQADFEVWLEENHQSSTGIWLRMAKKGSGTQSITYPEAVDAALCYGWIDGQSKSESAEFWRQRFTPRTKKSIWSKVNREKVAALIASGRMRPGGQQEIDRAKADGRWDAAYDSPKQATVPEDFQAALNRNAKAKKFFSTLNSQNRYAILFRLQTAKKPETRARRIEQFVEMLSKGEKLHN